MEGEKSKRKECESESEEGEVIRKIARVGDLSEGEGEDELEIGEDTLSEVMMWLEQEVDSSSSSVSSPASNYRQETQFVTINGNEESCGPSFSGSASTVMASVDTRGVAVVPCLVGGPTDRPAEWQAPDPLSWPWAGCATAGEDEDEDAWGLELDGDTDVEGGRGLGFCCLM